MAIYPEVGPNPDGKNYPLIDARLDWVGALADLKAWLGGRKFRPPFSIAWLDGVAGITASDPPIESGLVGPFPGPWAMHDGGDVSLPASCEAAPGVAAPAWQSTSSSAVDPFRWSIPIPEAGIAYIGLRYMADDDLARSARVEIGGAASEGPLAFDLSMTAASTIPIVADWSLLRDGSYQALRFAGPGTLTVSIYGSEDDNDNERPVRVDQLMVYFTPADLSTLVAQNAADFIILDDDGDPVLDTRRAMRYRRAPWGLGLIRHDWTGDDWTARIVQRSGLSAPQPLLDSGMLDPETVLLAPMDVRQFWAWSPAPRRPDRIWKGHHLPGPQGQQRADAPDVVLREGYNVRLLPEAIAGGGRVSIDVGPNFGAGAAPGTGAGASDLALRTLGGVGPDAARNISVFGNNGCITARPDASYYAPTPGMDDRWSGVARRVPGSIQLGNDCGGCCDCGDYQGPLDMLVDVHGRLAALVARHDTVTEMREDMTDAWDLSKTCREADRLQLVLAPSDCRYVDVVLAVCNPNKYTTADNGERSVCVDMTIAIQPDCTRHLNCRPGGEVGFEWEPDEPDSSPVGPNPPGPDDPCNYADQYKAVRISPGTSFQSDDCGRLAPKEFRKFGRDAASCPPPFIADPAPYRLNWPRVAASGQAVARFRIEVDSPFRETVVTVQVHTHADGVYPAQTVTRSTSLLPCPDPEEELGGSSFRGGGSPYGGGDGGSSGAVGCPAYIRVLGMNNNPYAGATVTVGDSTGITDDQGKATVIIPGEGYYYVTVIREGYEPDTSLRYLLCNTEPGGTGGDPGGPNVVPPGTIDPGYSDAGAGMCCFQSNNPYPVPNSFPVDNDYGTFTATRVPDTCFWDGEQEIPLPTTSTWYVRRIEPAPDPLPGGCSMPGSYKQCLDSSAWVYVYDNQGASAPCIPGTDSVTALEEDVSIGMVKVRWRLSYGSSGSGIGFSANVGAKALLYLSQQNVPCGYRGFRADDDDQFCAAFGYDGTQKLVFLDWDTTEVDAIQEGTRTYFGCLSPQYSCSGTTTKSVSVGAAIGPPSMTLPPFAADGPGSCGRGTVTLNRTGPNVAKYCPIPLTFLRIRVGGG